MDASSAIRRAFRKLTANTRGQQTTTIGKYGGLDIQLLAYRDFGDWHYQVGLVGIQESGPRHYRRRRPEERVYWGNRKDNPDNMGRTLGLLGRRIAVETVPSLEQAIGQAERTLEELRPLLNKPFPGAQEIVEARQEVVRLTDLFNSFTPDTRRVREEQEDTDRVDPDALREEGAEYDPEVTAINAVHRDSAIRTYGSLSKQVAVASGVARRARHMVQVGTQMIRAVRKVQGDIRAGAVGSVAAAATATANLSAVIAVMPVASSFAGAVLGAAGFALGITGIGVGAGIASGRVITALRRAAKRASRASSNRKTQAEGQSLARSSTRWTR